MSDKRRFLKGVFRVVCSEGGQDLQGQKTPKCLKTLVFSGILVSLGKSLPLLQVEERNLKNTIWKTPFGTLRIPLMS